MVVVGPLPVGAPVTITFRLMFSVKSLSKRFLIQQLLLIHTTYYTYLIVHTYSIFLIMSSPMTIKFFITTTHSDQISTLNFGD